MSWPTRGAWPTACRARSPGRPGARGVLPRAAARVDVLRQYLGPGRTGGAARVVRRRQVHHRQPADRPRPAADRGRCASRTAAGRHTSTAGSSSLLPESGVLIDTPGMRELQLWDTGETMGGDVRRHRGARRAAAAFATAGTCQEPGCAVRAAVEHGDAASRPARELSQAAGRAGASVAAADQRAQIDEKRRRGRSLHEGA